MANPLRRWLQFGPCANPTCTCRNMWGEVGIIVAERVKRKGRRDKIRYHNCCSVACAEELAQKLSSRLRNAPITICANPGCEGRVIGGGIQGVADVTNREKVYGGFCHRRCASRRWRWLQTNKAELLKAVDMRNRMMRPAPSKR